MRKVTDPELLQQLNSGGGNKVTDPDLLAQLNGEQKQQPEPMNKDDAIRAFFTSDTSGSKTMADGSYNPAYGMSPERKFATAIGRGFNDVGQGVTQIWKNLTGADDAEQYTKTKTEELRQYEKLAQDSPVLAGTGRLVGNVAATPIPAGVGASTAARVGTAGLSGGAVGAAQFVPEGGSRGVNTAISAGTGAVGQRLFGEPLRRFGAKGSPLSPDADEVVKVAKQQGIPVRYDDISRGSAARLAGQQIDQIPVIGGGASRQAQNEAAGKASQRITAKFAPLDEIDDLNQAVSKSARNNLDKFKQQASKMYDEALKPLDDAGQFDGSKIRQKAMELMQEETQKGSLADKKLMQELAKYTEAPEGNFSQWANFRSDLQSTIRTGEKGQNELVGDRAVGTLKRLSAEFNNVIDEQAAKVGGKAGQKWRDANKFYENNVIQFKKGALKNALKNGDDEKMLDMLIGTGAGTGRDSKTVAKQLYNGLDEKGRDLVRYGMVKRAMDLATSDDGVFSPARYASTLEKYNRRTGVFFKPEDKQMIDGVTKVMRHIQEAGSYAMNAKTGQKAVPTIYALGAGMGASASLPATATIGAGVLGIRQLMTTPRGRSMLTAIAKIPEKSKSFTDLMGKMSDYATRGLALKATNPEAEEENQ